MMRNFRFIRGCLLISMIMLAPNFAEAQPVDPLDTWNQRNPFATASNHLGTAYGNDTFVIVGSAGLILSSPDGVTWTSRTSPVPLANLNGVSFGNGIFVAAGNAGTIITSPDGVNWIQRISGVTTDLRGVGFGNETFVAVGNQGTIRTSADGVTWSPGNSGIATDLLGVAHGNNTFVAVGVSGVVLTSSNGVIWVPGFTGTGLALNGVAFGKGVFIAVGGNGIVLISTTGAAWIFGASGTTNTLQGIAVGNGPFVAVGIAGTIRTSNDGVNWTLRTPVTSLNLNAVGYGEGTYVATGASGIILQSNPVVAFSDVPLTHFAFTQVDAITVAGITTGCLADNPATLQNEALYCPDSSITRAEMAVFIETSLGNPPNVCTGTRFTDVNVATVGETFCGFIERLAADGITGGCTPFQYCPNAPVTRAEMAVFIETALQNPPNICTGARFTDVNAATVGVAFCGFIERLAADGITGGCTPIQFCPNNPVSRAEMAVFLVAAPTPLDP